MGFISDLAKSNSAPELRPSYRTSAFPGAGEGRALWRQIFGSTTKEDTHKPAPPPGGSWGRSVLSSDASVKRLIQAFRSRAPGGWSDDRWEQTKHYVGVAFVAISNICKQMSQAEFKVFVKDPAHPDGKRPVTPNTPPSGEASKNGAKPYDLIELLEKPNHDDSFGSCMFRWSQQLRLTGSAYTWMVPNVLATPMELYPIPTAMAIPQPVINPEYPHGFYRIQPLYPYGPFTSHPTPNSSVGAPIGGQWMMKFRYPHPFLRYEGYSPLTGLRVHLDEVEMMDRARHYSMRRAISPSGILSFDNMEGMQPLPEEEIERIRSEFEIDHQGPENSGRLFVSPPGANLELINAVQKEMEYTGGWDQLVSFCMGGFGITKPAAGMVEDGSYATLFATLKQLHLLTLQPDCNDIASSITRTLAPFFGDDLIVEIKCARIDDHEIRNQTINLAIAARAITKNQVLKLLELPTTNAPWGNEIAGVEPMQPQANGPTAQQAGSPESQMAMQAVLGGALDEEQKLEPNEVNTSRPGAEELSQGSLGPRKALDREEILDKALKRVVYAPPDEEHEGSEEQEAPMSTKSFYDRVREVISNGHV